MKVRFFNVDVFEHIDERRTIRDVTLSEGIEIPFEIRQLKIIELSIKAVKKRLVLGDHYHTEKSGRWELFVAVGKPHDALSPLFEFRFRETGGKIQKRDLRAGDACLIPPGITHSFVGLVTGVQLWGYSNLPYDSSHDVEEKLF